MPPTPGVLFLIRALPTLVVPSVLFYFLSTRILKVYFAPLAHVSDLALGFASIFVLPCFFIARVQHLLFRNRRRANALGARLVDTPGGWPGNIKETLQVVKQIQTGYPGDGLRLILADHGNVYNRRPVFEDIIITTEPQHIKCILSTDFTNFNKGDAFQFACRSVLGHGVFNADGEIWKFHRSMTRPFFNRDRISDFETFDRQTDEIIGLMKKRLSEGYSVDFQDAISRFTLDSATEFLFGSSVNSKSTGLPYPHHAPSYLLKKSSSSSESGVAPTLSSNASASSSVSSFATTTADAFATAFAKCQFVLFDRLVFGSLWPLFEIKRNKTDDPMRVVNAFVEPIVREAVRKNKLRQQQEEKGEGEKGGGENEVGEDETLLDHLVKYTTDEKIIRDETTNILIAGRDTIASTLTFLFFFLSTHPLVTSRLRTEVLEHVGPTRMPAYDDIKHMKYLRAVINETLRLYPPVPANSRCTVGESLWPASGVGEKPYYIPPNTRVGYSVMMMQRRTDLWGPDAEEFDPDRFLDERLKTYLLPNNFIFLPFNAGPRICLGQQFAYNEMSFFIIRMLQNFSSFALDRDSHPPGTLPPKEWEKDLGRKGRDGLYPKTHLTMYNHGGLWMKMQVDKEG